MEDESGGKVRESRRDVDGLKSAEAEPHGRGRSRKCESLAYLGDRRDELRGGEVANVREPITRPLERQHAIAQIAVDVGTQWRRCRRVSAREAQDGFTHARRESHLDPAYFGVHQARAHPTILQGDPAGRERQSGPSPRLAATRR